MRKINSNSEFIRKLALAAIMVALATVLSFIKIPIIGASITLMLPVVVIGAALCGPVVGACMTIIPNLLALTEAGIFLTNAPGGCVVTLLLKGILAGYVSGIIYRVLSKKRPIAAIACSAVVAPIINSGIFTLGCYIFIWEELVAAGTEAGVGIGMLLFGLVGLNFIIELIFNIVLCPTIIRIIHIFTKKKLA